MQANPSWSTLSKHKVWPPAREMASRIYHAQVLLSIMMHLRVASADTTAVGNMEQREFRPADPKDVPGP